MNYLVLVNKENKLPENWDKSLELDTINKDIKIERQALISFNELKSALLKENIIINIDSGYRSIEDQQRIWNDFKDKYGIDYVNKYVALPGYSEHHTGLAIDINLIKDRKVISSNEEMLKEKDIFNIIHRNLSDYGFILRYPEYKEKITGYGYEPWHIRYVRDINVSKEIMDSQITIEEYLDNKNKK